MADDALLAQVCTDYYRDVVPGRGKPHGAERTAVAWVVAEFGSSNDGLTVHRRVLACGTGTKCIGGKPMREDGTLVNDSHAEVLCRRAFRLHLLAEAERLYLQREGAADSVLRIDADTGLLRLRAGVTLRFVCSQTPCGDAAIFGIPSQDSAPATEEDCSAAKRRRVDPVDSTVPTEEAGREVLGDVHRTGGKPVAGEEEDPRGCGSSWHATGVLRCKPGRGPRTLSHACSDKLALWAAVGCQGALLSLLLAEPIRFASVTVLDPSTCTAALARALNRAVGACPSLPPPFSCPQSAAAPAVALLPLPPNAPGAGLSPPPGQGKQADKGSASPQPANCATAVAFSQGVVHDVVIAHRGMSHGVAKRDLERCPGPMVSRRQYLVRFCRVARSIAAAGGQEPLRQELEQFLQATAAGEAYSALKARAQAYATAKGVLRTEGGPLEKWQRKDPALQKFALRAEDLR